MIFPDFKYKTLYYIAVLILYQEGFWKSFDFFSDFYFIVAGVYPVVATFTPWYAITLLIKTIYVLKKGVILQYKNTKKWKNVLVTYLMF